MLEPIPQPDACEQCGEETPDLYLRKMMKPIECGECKACCINDAVRPMPHELGRYHTEIYLGVPILKHKENGECFYLGKDGCTIHHWKPQKCREMDCRALLASVGATQMAQVCSPEVVMAAMMQTAMAQDEEDPDAT